MIKKQSPGMFLTVKNTTDRTKILEAMFYNLVQKIKKKFLCA